MKYVDKKVEILKNKKNFVYWSLLSIGSRIHSHRTLHSTLNYVKLFCGFEYFPRAILMSEKPHFE